jgi:hypothetical protein
VVINGDPPLEVRVMGGVEPMGAGLSMGCRGPRCSARPPCPVCDARPGVITHLDLGVVQPRGLVRQAVEGLENAFQLRLGDSWAVVADQKHALIGAALHADRCGGRKLARVIDQIRQCPAQRLRSSEHRVLNGAR